MLANAGGEAITFTATTSPSGTLLLGSSREFADWDTTPSPTIVSGILSRAATFLPHLAQLTASEMPLTAPWLRVGLRPFSTNMRPMIGPIPDVPGLYIVAGHEGSGLTLGPGTGDLLAQHILAPAAELALGAAFLP